MRKVIFTYAVIAFLMVSCKETPKETMAEAETPELTETPSEEVSSENSVAGDVSTCKEGESLVFQGETFASYTEDKMRGKGVVSFTMDINDRLAILDIEDDGNFGEIVLNEDMTYFTLTMPKKVIARRVITNYDFAAFDFDAEDVNTDKDYLFIYVNKEKRKVKKSDLKYTFSTWEDYIKKRTITLKDCNLLTDSSNKPNAKSKGLAYTVTEIKGDEIKIKSTKDCLGEDAPFQNLEGKVKWKSGNALVIDLAVCN
ncbi:MAG: hypothetical protein DI539_06365 [Flavobacterium psychrophilum]|nr:MAG: hypothetical protein DI539_06365 [Flavobacterium psychrophilum]